MINQKLAEFEEEVKPIGDIMTQATIEMYEGVVGRFLPTPTKIHYLFNLRDISKVGSSTAVFLPFSYKRPIFAYMYMHVHVWCRLPSRAF